MDARSKGQRLPSRQLQCVTHHERHWIAWRGDEIVARAKSLYGLIETCQALDVEPDRFDLDWRPMPSGAKQQFFDAGEHQVILVEDESSSDRFTLASGDNTFHIRLS